MLEGLKRSTYLLVYFLLQTAATLSRVLGAVLWRGARTARIAALALCAGAVEVAIDELVVGRVTLHSHKAAIVSEDYVAWAGTVLLYAAGMFYGKRRVDRKRPHGGGRSDEGTTEWHSGPAPNVGGGRWSCDQPVHDHRPTLTFG